VPETPNRSNYKNFDGRRCHRNILILFPMNEIQKHIDEILELIPLPQNPDAKDKLKKISIERQLIEWYVELENYLEDNHIEKRTGNTSINQTSIGSHNSQNAEL